MSNELATAQSGSKVIAAALEQVVVANDLSTLTPAQRLEFYSGICNSLGLNPLTRPFQYIVLNGKLTLYATKDCTEQLRKIYNVSITLTDKRFDQDVYIVTAQARTPDGRTDESTGAVTIGNLKGDARANALMKAETKAKRRVTLSICGMGMLDENEVATIAGATFVKADYETGEIGEMKSLELANGSAWSATVRKAIEEMQLTKTEYHKLGEICDKHGFRTDRIVVDAFDLKCDSFDDVVGYLAGITGDESLSPKVPDVPGDDPYNPLDDPAPAHEFVLTPKQIALASTLAKQIRISADALMAQGWEQGIRTFDGLKSFAAELNEIKEKAVAS